MLCIILNLIYKKKKTTVKWNIFYFPIIISYFTDLLSHTLMTLRPTFSPLQLLNSYGFHSSENIFALISLYHKGLIWFFRRGENIFTCFFLFVLQLLGRTYVAFSFFQNCLYFRWFFNDWVSSNRLNNPEWLYIMMQSYFMAVSVSRWSFCSHGVAYYPQYWINILTNLVMLSTI